MIIRLPFLHDLIIQGIWNGFMNNMFRINSCTRIPKQRHEIAQYIIWTTYNK